MIFLADVNLLLALGWSHHTGHAKAQGWLNRFRKDDALATCAITELGFVRISLQPAFGSADITIAKKALAQLRAAKRGHVFLSDALDAAALPAWVKTTRQTTDGHLAALAAAHGASLATLDTGIPGAVLV